MDNNKTTTTTTTPEPIITLRPFTLADIDDFMVWASDDKVSRFCRWDTYTNKEDLIKFMTNIVLPHPWFRAICLNGSPIGAISVTPSSEERCEGELGYALASEHWGKGIGTAALKMTLAAGLGLDLVVLEEVLEVVVVPVVRGGLGGGGGAGGDCLSLKEDLYGRLFPRWNPNPKPYRKSLWASRPKPKKQRGGSLKPERSTATSRLAAGQVTILRRGQHLDAFLELDNVVFEIG
ncbi:hypothetical protein J5N97_010788 [Dioscorea zingiberensis]|uniref:N-acetyltransferase domain-containing protein n=1 Tax=Dioscorea zingiberensis TaxID=325984 RepID=A0A9D5HMZ6_9LILI|nr:hypothetical protein J5N97_010788 [Dioscorea zingiberensis]